MAEIGQTHLVTTPQTLVFGTFDPDGILTQATKVADRLAPLIKQRRLYKSINGRDHVYVEGWTSMIAMLGIFPHIEWTKRLDRKDEIAYEARVVLRHISGMEIGAGEAICSSKEANWRNRDEYAIKSMAQTRTVGKACRLSFSWIMALTGYDPTPLEEMDQSTKTHKTIDAPVVNQVKSSPTILSDKQVKYFWAKVKALEIAENILRAIVKDVRGEESTKGMTQDQMDLILQACEDYVRQKTEQGVVE